jgi:hypothetical protein
MHFLGSYQKVVPIIVLVFDNKQTTHSFTLFLEEEAIHNHPLLQMSFQWPMPLPLF